ncbi:MAG: hypothetical protein P8L45_01065 [Longimicrobiales bacterium]|nr:hypothetical protein [Longimicrobiales bacterium]
MARSVRAALRARGAATEEQDTVVRVFALAMQTRIATLEDDHHPAWLHPGRSALILLHDVERVDPIVLIIAALHESVDLVLQPPPGQIQKVVGASAWQTLQSIPMPGSERLVERLLLLGPGLALAALAERLDHLRHLHLREDLIDHWADTHVEVAAAWLPFAARVHPTLGKRYAHWFRTFAKRL